jgi:hypothetical protein
MALSSDAPQLISGYQNYLAVQGIPPSFLPGTVPLTDAGVVTTTMAFSTGANTGTITGSTAGLVPGMLIAPNNINMFSSQSGVTLTGLAGTTGTFSSSFANTGTQTVYFYNPVNFSESPVLGSTGFGGVNGTTIQANGNASYVAAFHTGASGNTTKVTFDEGGLYTGTLSNNSSGMTLSPTGGYLGVLSLNPTGLSYVSTGTFGSVHVNTALNPQCFQSSSVAGATGTATLYNPIGGSGAALQIFTIGFNNYSNATTQTLNYVSPTLTPPAVLYAPPGITITTGTASMTVTGTNTGTLTGIVVGR